MNKVLMIIICVLVVIILITLVIVWLKSITTNKKIEKEMETLKQEKKNNAEQTKINNKEKEKFETGSAVDDFNATINVLSNLKE